MWVGSRVRLETGRINLLARCKVELAGVELYKGRDSCVVPSTRSVFVEAIPLIDQGVLRLL